MSKREGLTQTMFQLTEEERRRLAALVGQAPGDYGALTSGLRRAIVLAEEFLAQQERRDSEEGGDG